MESPKERVVMCEFTDDELLMLINGAHHRGMTLLDTAGRMSQVGYADEAGREPTLDDIRHLEQGHKDYLALVDKVRSYRRTLDT